MRFITHKSPEKEEKVLTAPLAHLPTEEKRDTSVFMKK